MGESFLTSWPKHSRIRLGRQERREGGRNMQETWHVKDGDKGHLLVCLKQGRMRRLLGEKVLQMRCNIVYCYF